MSGDQDAAAPRMGPTLRSPADFSEALAAAKAAAAAAGGGSSDAGSSHACCLVQWLHNICVLLENSVQNPQNSLAEPQRQLHHIASARNRCTLSSQCYPFFQTKQLILLRPLPHLFGGFHMEGGKFLSALQVYSCTLTHNQDLVTNSGEGSLLCRLLGSLESRIGAPP